MRRDPVHSINCRANGTFQSRSSKRCSFRWVRNVLNHSLDCSIYYQPLRSPHHPKPKGGRSAIHYSTKSTNCQKQHQPNRATLLRNNHPSENATFREDDAHPHYEVSATAKHHPGVLPAAKHHLRWLCKVLRSTNAPMHHQLQKKSTTPLSHCEAHPTA